MKIVLFGDSNTWGYDPRTGLQQPDRFVQGLRRLHPEWIIDDYGFNGRLMYSPDPALRQISGAAALPRSLRQAAPYDLLVIALGANDARRMFHQTLRGWMNAFEVLVDTACQANLEVCRTVGEEQPVPILFVEPFPVPAALEKNEAVQAALGESGIRILKACGPRMEQAIEDAGCLAFSSLKAGIHGGDVDGIHLDSSGHRRLAQALSAAIEDIVLSNRQNTSEQDMNRQRAFAAVTIQKEGTL